MPQQFSRESRVEGRGFSIRAEAGRAEILLYDVIDPWYGMSAKQFHDELKALGEVSAIDLRINSPGGSITEGMAVYSILKRQTAKITAHVDGIAASMASIVAMAAGEIVMAQGAYMMIHNPLGVVMGDSEEMRDYAALLDTMKSQLVNIYAARTKQSAEVVAALMDAETWFTADEAIAAGFADRSTAQLALAAQIDPTRFSHLPQPLRGEAQMSQASLASETVPTETKTAPPQPAAFADLKAALPGADAAFLCSQLEANATVAQAQTGWMAEQNRRLEAAGKLVADAQAAAAANRSGVEPLGSGSTAAGAATDTDPIVAWNELVAAKIRAGKPKAKAISDVIAENPALHDEYLAAYNAARK